MHKIIFFPENYHDYLKQIFLFGQNRIQWNSLHAFVVVFWLFSKLTFFKKFLQVHIWSVKLYFHAQLKCCKIKLFWLLILFMMLVLNVELPKDYDILTFTSSINFMLSWVQHEKRFITSRPDVRYWGVMMLQYFTLVVLTLCPGRVVKMIAEFSDFFGCSQISAPFPMEFRWLFSQFGKITIFKFFLFYFFLRFLIQSLHTQATWWQSTTIASCFSFNVMTLVCVIANLVFNWRKMPGLCTITNFPI